MRINNGTAQQLIQQYTTSHWAIINDTCPQFANGDMEDSRSVWYSLEELTNFINAVQTAGGNGIRFYFGEYTQATLNATMTQLQQANQNNADISATDLQDRIQNLQQCIPGMHTLVMIPTARDYVNKIDVDYNIVRMSTDFSHSADLVGEDHAGMIPPPPGIDTSYAAVCGAQMLDIVDNMITAD